MTRDTIIGGDVPAKGRKCAHCGEKFGISEFISYMLKFWDKHIFCLACQKNNFLEKPDSGTANLVALIIALLIGGSISLVALLILVSAVYTIMTGGAGTFIISAPLFIFGITVMNFILSFFRWFNGTIVKRGKDDIANEAAMDEFMKR